MSYSLIGFYAMTVAALIALAIMVMRNATENAALRAQLEVMNKRADDYAAAIIQHPDMCEVPEVLFTDITRRAHAIALRNEKIKQQRAHVHTFGTTPKGRDNLTAPGGSPATLQRAALNTPMQRAKPPAMPAMLASAGIIMGTRGDTSPSEIDTPARGGAVTTPGKLT